MEQLELKDIQGVIPRGYGSLSVHVTFCLVREPGAAKAWLGALTDRITAGDVSPQDSAINVASHLLGCGPARMPGERLATWRKSSGGHRRSGTGSASWAMSMRAPPTGGIGEGQLPRPLMYC